MRLRIHSFIRNGQFQEQNERFAETREVFPFACFLLFRCLFWGRLVAHLNEKGLKTRIIICVVFTRVDSFGGFSGCTQAFFMRSTISL